MANLLLFIIIYKLENSAFILLADDNVPWIIQVVFHDNYFNIYTLKPLLIWLEGSVKERVNCTFHNLLYLNATNPLLTKNVHPDLYVVAEK